MNSCQQILINENEACCVKFFIYSLVLHRLKRLCHLHWLCHLKWFCQIKSGNIILRRKGILSYVSGSGSSIEICNPAAFPNKCFNMQISRRLAQGYPTVSKHHIKLAQSVKGIILIKINISLGRILCDFKVYFGTQGLGNLRIENTISKFILLST